MRYELIGVIGPLFIASSEPASRAGPVPRHVRATVAGFAEEPPADTAGGGVRITVPGVTLAFGNATVSRSGKTLTVVVATEKPATEATPN